MRNLVGLDGSLYRYEKGDMASLLLGISILF